MSKLTLFKEYCEAIIRDGDFHEGLAPAITGLADMLYKLAEVNGNTELERKHISTESGSAIGTFWAAQCIKEIFRTQRFARGLFKAIQHVRQKHTGRPAHVLYAGTGPFATLALPAMALLTPKDVQFTMLEINPKSYKMLQYILNALGLNSFVRHVTMTDAATYKLCNDDVDIVLSETMNRALIKEPQVSIMLNLASQLSQKTIFIPEEIKVSLYQHDTNDKMGHKLDDLMVFDKKFMFELIEKCKNSEWLFEEKKLTVDLLPSTVLHYETEIKVYQSDFLKSSDCSLNFPEKLKTKDLIGRKVLKIHYTSIDIPGFRCQFLD